MTIQLLEDVQVGAKLGPITIHLHEDLVRRYRDMLGLPGEAGVERYCPPTILETYVAGLAVDRFKYRERGAVHIKLHAKTSFRFVRPIPIGTKVTLTGELVDVCTKDDREYLVIRCRATNEQGERLLEMELHNTFGGGSRPIARYPSDRTIEFEW